jgi:hypothetical protein
MSVIRGIGPLTKVDLGHGDLLDIQSTVFVKARSVASSGHVVDFSEHAWERTLTLFKSTPTKTAR